MDKLNSATTTEPSRKEQTLRIGGMTCASCVRRIEKALMKVPGVKEATKRRTSGNRARVD